uniref:RecA family profile 1 domain-containing protein n=1 Tax=Bionectria ochroleuca TaxID=29856 RepID=A0A8H7TTI6_BIOOC
MDYHSIHGHDVANFDVPSSHRLPTVSASAILDELKDDSSTYVSTGLPDLDKKLQSATSSESQDLDVTGGIKRGQVTELWGPPGSGKTAIGIQLTANALANGDTVVWVDCFQSVSLDRMTKVVDVAKKSQASEPDPHKESQESEEEALGGVTHYNCLTLPHFIALVSKPSPRLIPENTSLFIVSSLTTLINSVLPKPKDAQRGMLHNKGPSAFAKRQQALQAIMKALQTLASTRKCAVVLLSQCATKMRLERGASLIPAVAASVWEQNISTRIALFRDWSWRDNTPSSIFLAGLQKLDGKVSEDMMEHASAFSVSGYGVASACYDGGGRRSSGIAPMTQHKRKLGNTDFEVPDSEDDEDYGWANEDDAHLPPPPSQWQGSEDILLGQAVGRSDDGSDWDEGDVEGHTSPDRLTGKSTPLSAGSPQSSHAGDESGAT